MMPGPGISVMWHSRVRRCWFAWGKAEYITARRPAGQKKKRDAEHGECGTFCGDPEKTRNQDVM